MHCTDNVCSTHAAFCVNRYNDVQRWVKKSKCPKGLHNYDLVVIPIHLGIHWACGFIDFKRKTIEYYDSMGGSEIAFYSVMLAYLEDYYDDTAAWTNGFVFKKDEWAGVRNVERDIQDLELNDVTPQQDDGYSCGVFALKFAEYRMMNCRFCFTYKDIANFRLQMALALWNTGEQVEEGISAVDNA
jgi:sentrin-specific protease 1